MNKDYKKLYEAERRQSDELKMKLEELKDNICLEIAGYSELSAKASKDLINLIRAC